MTLKYQKEISNICLIKTFRDNIYYSTKEGSLFCEGEKIASSLEPTSFWLISNLIYYHDIEGLHHYIINHEEIISDKAIFWETYEEEKAISSYNFKRENQSWHWDNGEFSIMDNKVIQQYPLYKDCLITKKINNQYFGLNANKHICLFNILETKIEWQFDVSEIGKYQSFLCDEIKQGEVKYIIGVYQNQLVVLLKGGKFISLDINVGHLLWEKHTVDINNTSQDIEYGFNDPTFPFYDKEKGEIYILQGDSFIFFDLKSGLASYEWTPNDQKEENEEKSIFIRNSGLYKDKIHFTARLENSSTYDVIGIFDITQKKIIWQYKFEFDKHNFIVQTQMTDTHFYARDIENHMYVFEKEINNQIYG